MKNRLLFLILSCMFLFAACNKAGDDRPEFTDTPSEQVQFDPETDFNNRFSGLCSIWENDDMYAWIPVEGEHIYYYDKATDDYGVLCPRPDCQHPLDDSCSAYILFGRHALSYQKGKLCYVANGGGSPQQLCVYSMNIDGSDKAILAEIPTIEALGGTPQQFYIHRNVLYMSISADIVEDGKPYMKQSFAALDLSDGKLTILYEEQVQSWIEGNSMVFMGNCAYFFTTAWLDDGSPRNKIMCWNAHDDKLEVIMDAVMDGGIPTNGGLWVDNEQRVYFSTQEDPAKIFRVENNKPVEIISFEDPDGNYDYAFLSDGLAISLGGNDSDEKLIWVCDYSGETIYKGVLPLPFDRDLPYSIYGVNGKGNEILAEFMIESDSEDGSGSESYLVAYTITDEGLEYRIIGRACK